MADSPGPMEWQRTGGFARGLRAHGVRSIIIGDLTDEWYGYSFAEPIRIVGDVVPKLERYFPADIVRTIVAKFPTLPDDAPSEDAQKMFGEILSLGQVHLPVRLVLRDLLGAGFPVSRYEIRWAPEKGLKDGYVSHASDRSIWAFRVRDLGVEEIEVARTWLNAVFAEAKALEEEGKPLRGLTEILTLRENSTVQWTDDKFRWKEIMRFSEVLPGED